MRDRSRVFASHASAPLTPAIIFRARARARRANLAGCEFALPGSGPGTFVGRQSRWAGQEFLGVRRGASGTHRRSIARSPETRRESSLRGRSPRLARTLPHVEEDTLARDVRLVSPVITGYPVRASAT